MEVQQIEIAAIHPDLAQPRKEFEATALTELASSMQANGLLQPITVRRNGAGYILIAGERRWRAAHQLGWPTMPAIVYEGTAVRELQLVENINRVDLNPMELAEAYRDYLADGHTVDDLAKVVGKPKATITWLMGILRCRPDIQHLLRTGQLSIVLGVALGKLSLNGQSRAIRLMNENRLPVAECQKLCASIWAEENQAEMFAEEPKLSATELKARRKIESALTRAWQAFEEIAWIERDNPGISCQAVADRIEATWEQVDTLYDHVKRFRDQLRTRRVALLC